MSIHDEQKKVATGITDGTTQQEQGEPVAWLSRRYVDNFPASGYETAQPTDYGAFPVYTTPQQRKPLTDEEARVKFESWHKSEYVQPLERYAHTYKNMHVRNRWQGWLAAHGIKEENNTTP